MTEAGAPDGADLLAAFQRLAWSTIVLSVTQRCPLACDHCITSSSPTASRRMLDVDTATRWAAEMPDLAAMGLRHITFTGGEPTLALEPVGILADAAVDVGVETAVVTSGAFATTDRAAERVVARLDRVTRWDLGYDVFHAAFLPFDRFGRAVAALRRAHKLFCIRVCEGPDRDATAELLGALQELCGDDGQIILQPVRALGRAGERDVASPAPPASPTLPCTSTGVLVRDDGGVAPCCSGLAYAADHPFLLGNACEDGLATVWGRWRDDQLLRLMRLVGLAPVHSWLRQEGVPAEGAETVADVCEACVATWAVPGAAEAARRRADAEGIRVRLDGVETALYGAVWHPLHAG